MRKYLKILAAAAAVIIAAAPVSINTDTAEAETADRKEIECSEEALSSVGSVSKMYVTTAALQLYEQGKIDIDEKITAYLPEFKMADPRYKEITVRMLMNHSSGLMGTTAGDFMLMDDADISTHDSLLEKLSVQRLKADPGDYSTYCNDGFTLLELIVERVSGESFTEYIENHISRPMGFEKTGTPWNRMGDENQVSVFYRKTEMFPDYCMAIGSGGILSTAGELCRFGTAFFKGNDVLLSDKTKEMMNTSCAKDEYEDGFGLGWDSVSDPDYSDKNVTVLSKGGDIHMQHAELLTAPDHEISIAVLSSGGNSSLNKLMAEALMDIALDEKGIEITHRRSAEKELAGPVPESYRQYEDIYVSVGGVFRVTFPDMKYLQIEQLDSVRKNVQKFMYTTEESFVLAEENSSGEIKQKKDSSVLTFRKRNGTDYICESRESGTSETGITKNSVYIMQRTGKNPLDSDVKKAWNERFGKKYLYINGKYSNMYYLANPYIEINRTQDTEGYVNHCRIVSENRAEVCASIPGSGRDLSDIEFSSENGAEILTLAGQKYISEDAVPDFDFSAGKIQLISGRASWFRLNGASGITLNFDIPEKASVYVYDKFGNAVYSSYMKDYGRSVPLPDEGFIAFIGENGAEVKIS